VGVAVGRGFDAVAIGLCAFEPCADAGAEAAVVLGWRQHCVRRRARGEAAQWHRGALDVSTSATARPSAVARFAIRRGHIQVRGFKRDRRFVQGRAPTNRPRIADGPVRSALERRFSRPTGCSGEIWLASSCAGGAASSAGAGASPTGAAALARAVAISAMAAASRVRDPLRRALCRQIVQPDLHSTHPGGPRRVDYGRPDPANTAPVNGAMGYGNVICAVRFRVLAIGGCVPQLDQVCLRRTTFAVKAGLM